jgi:transcriptional regulator with XRE-family HTH domain
VPSSRIKNRMRDIRKRKGLTQKNVANFLGITVEAYRGLEKNTSTAHHIETLIKLCSLFSCEISDLASANFRYETLPTLPCTTLEQFHEEVRRMGTPSARKSNYVSNIPQLLSELEENGRKLSDIRRILDIAESTLRNWKKKGHLPCMLVRCIQLCIFLECDLKELVDIPNTSSKELSQITSDFKNSISSSFHSENRIDTDTKHQPNGQKEVTE